MNNGTRPKSMLANMMTCAAQAIGAEIVFDPDWQYAGRITFSSGRRTYFRGPSLDINPHGSSEVAKDKDYASFFMRSLGFPAVGGLTFFSDEWAAFIGSDRNETAAILHGQEIGYPLVVKPNSQSQGRGVSIVHCDEDLRVAVSACLELDRVIILQPFIQGRDYRIVVFGGEVIFAYERVPLHVIGDGKHSIEQLHLRKLETLQSCGRMIRIPLDDHRVAAALRRHGHLPEAIPTVGEVVYLLEIANLSTGGDAIDVSKLISSGVRKLCANLAKDMGLQLCGIDLLLDGDICRELTSLHIVEINSSPGMENYAAIGSEQFESVEALYRRVLHHLEDRVGRPSSAW